MSQKKDIIKSILVLTIICVVISGALAVVNSFTAPVSAANAAIREDEARRAVVPDAASFEKVEGVEISSRISAAYAAKNEAGESIAYVFSVDGTGFGGKISIICGIDANGAILKCQTLDVSGETKTLGGKVTSPDYTNQYIGQDSSLSGVEAISGATITSNAYKNCVQTAFEAFAQIKEAGK